MSKYSKEIYIYNDLRIYKDGFSYQGKSFTESDIESVDVYDRYIIIVHRCPYDNFTSIMTYFKNDQKRQPGSGTRTHEYGSFIYSGKLHEWHKNDKRSYIPLGINMYVYDDTSKKYRSYGVESWDLLGLMRKIYKKDDISYNDFTMPERVYSNDWPDLKILRDKLNDISMICFE